MRSGDTLDIFYTPKRRNKDFSRKDFKVGQKLRIIYNAPIDATHPRRQQRNVNGRVAELTDYVLVIQRKNYREDFKFTDFTTGLAVIM